MLKEGFGNVVDVEHTNTKSSSIETLENIVSVIQEGIPVVISVMNNNLNHAMLAIGYEKENENVKRVLCLDPSGDYIRGRQRWNATIDVNMKRKNVFIYQSVLEGEKSNQYVDLDDILIIRML